MVTGRDRTEWVWIPLRTFRGGVGRKERHGRAPVQGDPSLQTFPLMISKRDIMTRVSLGQTLEPLVDDFCQNELFDVLGNRRRRFILCYLVLEKEAVECRELAEKIAAWEDDTSEDGVPTTKYQSVYNSLYQSHLPKLDSMEFVDYDRSENLVAPSDQLPEIERVLDTVVTNARGPVHTNRMLLSGTLLGGASVGAFVFFFTCSAWGPFVLVLLTLVAMPVGGMVL